MWRSRQSAIRRNTLNPSFHNSTTEAVGQTGSASWGTTEAVGPSVSGILRGVLISRDAQIVLVESTIFVLVESTISPHKK